MGILSGAKEFLTKNPVGQKITKGLNVFSGVVQNPITAITKGAPAAEQQFLKDSPIQRATKTLITTGTAVAATLGAGTVAGRALLGQAIKSAPTVAKSLIPKSFIGKVAGTAAVTAGAPLLFGQIAKDPAAAARAVEQAPSKIIGFQENLYGFSKDPSLEKAQKIFQDNPFLATGTAAALAAPLISAVPAGIGFVAGEVLGSKDKKEKLTVELPTTPLTTGTAATTAQTDTSFSSVAAPSPIAPITAPVSQRTATVRKRRRKTRRKTEYAKKVTINIKDNAGKDTYNFKDI